MERRERRGSEGGAVRGEGSWRGGEWRACGKVAEEEKKQDQEEEGK